MKAAAARWLLAGVAALLGACASIEATGVPAATHATITACARWFEQLDLAVEQAGVRDAQADRIVPMSRSTWLPVRCRCAAWWWARTPG